MATITISAQPRSLRGKAVAQLRRAGRLPANIYGHNVASTAITVDMALFTRLHPKLAHTTILQLKLPDEAARPVMVQRATTDPRSRRFLHVEFYQVNLLEKITSTVPVVSTGTPEAVAHGSAILLQTLDHLEVEALPMDLPPDITVDVSGLHASHEGIFVRDLPVDRSKVTIKTPEDELVFKLAAPQAASADEVEDAAAAEAAAAEGAAAGAGEGDA